MNKEDILLEIAHKNSEIKAIKTEIDALNKEYIEKYAEYKCGDKVTAYLSYMTESPLLHLRCSKVTVKKDGTFDYEFKDGNHRIFGEQLTNIQKEVKEQL